MNITNAKVEMYSMVQQVCKEAEKWQQIVQRGRLTMKQIHTMLSRIFRIENQLNNASKSRALRSTERRIRSQFQRLATPIKMMRQHLESLTKIRDSTVRMENRMRVWIDDVVMARYKIMDSVKASYLMEILEFLRERYDAEWEVKDMVVYELEQVCHLQEMDVMMDAWCRCVHAGGDHFFEKMNRFSRAAEYRRVLYDLSTQ
ncbi:hypothetical protein KR018_009167 [Drosophila ironensis]|nr:hypothetical protein KR018_009167 [Drosophila ironensis]